MGLYMAVFGVCCWVDDGFADSMIKNIPFSMHEAMKRGVVFATILTPVLYFTQRLSLIHI